MIVIRTMSVRGKVDGLLHHDVEGSARSKKVSSIQPKITAPNGDTAFIETVLQPGEEREIYTVSGNNDQVTKLRGSWRLNFILDPTPNGGKMLTLLDETHSAMLFTIQLPLEALKQRDAHTSTPLQRLLNKQISGGASGLWGAVMSDDF